MERRKNKIVMVILEKQPAEPGVDVEEDLLSAIQNGLKPSLRHSVIVYCYVSRMYNIIVARLFKFR